MMEIGRVLLAIQFMTMHIVFSAGIDNITLEQLQKVMTEQSRELAAIKNVLTVTTNDLQSTKDELFGVKTELQSTTVQLISVKSDLKAFENEKSPGSNLSGMAAEVNFTKEALDLLYLGHRSTQNDIQDLKDQVDKLTSVSKSNNIGFLATSKTGDNGIQRQVELWPSHIIDTVFVVEQDTNLNFSRVDFNTGHCFNVATGTMTAPVTGFYLFNMDNMGAYSVKLVKTSNKQILGEGQSSNKQARFSVLAHLLKGEVVAVQLTTQLKSNTLVPNIRFSGVLIRAV